MFNNVEVLSAGTHRELRFRGVADYSYAAGLTSAPITFTEMNEAAKHYPVVFPRKGPPVAVLGLVGKNQYVNEDGQWTVPYVPAHVTRYPFILGDTQREGEMVVMVDPDAAHFRTDQGERLFDEDGTPTAVVERVKRFLSGYQEEAQQSIRLTERLFEAGVLQERVIQRKEGEQTTTVVHQLFVVDEEKLAALPDETITVWHRAGVLRLVYVHLLSLTNLRQLKA